MTNFPMMGLVTRESHFLAWSPNKPSDVEVIAYKAYQGKPMTE